MTDGLILAIVVVVVFLGIRSSVKHFARKLQERQADGMIKKDLKRENLRGKLWIIGKNYFNGRIRLIQKALRMPFAKQ